MHFTGMFFIILVKSPQSHLQPQNRRKMGKKDIALARFFEDEERYADLINAFVFKGRQVVRAADITERDTRATGVLKRIRGKFTVQKYRDVLRRVALGTEFVLIGIENQDEVHYAMPMFTLVLYYGKKPWDGARELRQMMGEKPLPRPLSRMINNYRIQVLRCGAFGRLNVLRRISMKLLDLSSEPGTRSGSGRSRKNAKAAPASMDEEAYDVITAVTGSEELEAVKEKYREEGGKINMCEAIRGMIEEGKQEGLSLGRREGKQQGEFEKAKTMARNMYRRGMSAEDAAAICEIEQKQMEKWFEEWSR